LEVGIIVRGLDYVEYDLQRDGYTLFREYGDLWRETSYCSPRRIGNGQVKGDVLFNSLMR
jgi:hypothetical protein